MSDAIVAYVGLGSNLGNPEASVRAAIKALNAPPAIVVSKQSSLYQTAPLEAGGDDYINAVVELRTKLSPIELLHFLQRIENQFGRVRPFQNAPRTLDCDLLLYDHDILTTPSLIIPHPRVQQRAFVLIPLMEIAPEIQIPGVGPLKALLAAVTDQQIRKVV